MATLLDQWNLASDHGFQERVASGWATASIAVTAEDPATANHAARRALAAKILAGVGPSTFNLALAVASNATIQGDFNPDNNYAPAPGKTEAILTNDIQFVINSLVDAFS